MERKLTQDWSEFRTITLEALENRREDTGIIVAIAHEKFDENASSIRLLMFDVGIRHVILTIAQLMHKLKREYPVEGIVELEKTFQDFFDMQLMTPEDKDLN